MASIKQVREIIDAGKSLKLVTQTYADVASIKLKKIRSDIERNRKFVDEISDVYSAVNSIAKKHGLSSPKRIKGVVSILITSNLRFYGSINNDITQTFMINSAKYPSDKIVIGLTGQKYLEAINFKTFESIVLKGDLPNTDELKMLIDKISVYNQIIVYYSKLQSVLIQKPTIIDLTHANKQFFANRKGAAESKIDYIFEPEVGKMLAFFENQITGTLLEQTFLESELSRTASRLISMDGAQIKADEYIKKEKRELERAYNLIENSKILESISSRLNLKNKI